MIRKSGSITNKIPPLAAFGVILGLWFLLTGAGWVPSYMLPSPVSVVTAFIHDFPTLMYHSGTTLLEAFYGLIIGVAFAFIMATLMDRHETLNRALYPVMVVTQTIPTVAIAPILVLWMGFGMAPKITLVVITTFFPIAVSLLDGYKSVDADAVNLLKTMGGSPWQIFYHVKFPSALPQFFSGLKVSASYAIVGAVIAEWLGGFEGLGVYMTRVRKAYAFDKMFAVIILIVIISLLLMAVVNLMGSAVMPWLKAGRSGRSS